MSKFSFSQFLNEHYSVDEYMVIQESVELNEGMFDEFFTTIAGKITAKHIEKYFYSNERLATTDGKWLLKFGNGSLAIADTSDPSQIKTVIFYHPNGSFIDDIKKLDKDKDIVQQVFDMAKTYSAYKATEDFESEFYLTYIQPYALKKYFTSADTKPITTKKIKFERLLNLIITGQITTDEDGNNAMKTLLQAGLKNNFVKQVKVDGDLLTIENKRGGIIASFNVPDGKIKTKTVKVSKEAGEGHKVYSYGHRKTPSVGDFLTTTIHYTMLSSFDVYEIVGFTGKTSIIVQELATDRTDDGHTTTIKVSKPKQVIGKPFEVKVSRTGNVKIHGKDASYTESKDFDKLKRTGSTYD